MSLQIASLNSGSNGNCYYVGNHNEAILIDAGVSCKETEQRMERLNLSLDKVKAVFISHEHIDHIRGVNQLCKKYSLPVYINPGTFKHSGIRIDKENVYHFNHHEKISFGGLTVVPFNKHHDAQDPVSFIIEHEGIKAGVITDIGQVCKTVIHYFRQCHACILESNYDEQLLQEGGYPMRLKKRISGGRGHISNIQALELFKKHKAGYMNHLLLGHLSKINNRPELVEQLYQSFQDDLTIVIASRDKESNLFEIDHPVRGKIIPLSLKKESKQLDLFYQD
ncbi:MAG: MBL fold metallo-hydrolase [Bacteroidetes bacterium]|nr:MBL fold metallo-hydrolase [Bacteroidota bacterium]